MSKGRIVFFDATEVRREKMRNAAMGVKAPKTASQNVEFVDKNVTPPIVESKTVAEPESKAYNDENDVLPFVEKAEAKHAAPAASAPAVNVSKEELEGALIAFVVEQTGYPDEMVEMDADLEGDLGIDSIKKAQLMGELNEKYHFVDVSAPADSDMSLDDFPTLASIRDYLLGKAGESGLKGGNVTANGSEVTLPKPEPKEEAAPAPKPAPAPAPKSTGAAPAVSKEELESALVAFVVEQTGYPEEMVEMDADLEGDLGIDSIKKAQLMGELNEKYHFVDVSAPADSDMSLDDFPTLASIRDYLLGKAGEAGSAPVEKKEVKPEPKEEAASAPKPAPAPAPKSTGAAPAVSKEELESALVSFVVEQTGYPEEMVEMDADLEGDLGIDSIKKAQLMGELNEKYHFVDVSAPADSDMSLDDFPTLASIRDYLLGKAGEAGSAPVEKKEAKPEPKAETAPASAPSSKSSVDNPNFKDELSAFLINFVVEQTGYPEEMVEMDVDLESDLGIDSIKKAQLFGELSEKYELVPLGDMSLDDFKTLRDIFNAILQCAR